MGSEDNTNVRAFLGMERFPWESCRDGRESRTVKSTVVWAQNTVGAAGSAQSHMEMKVRPRKWGEGGLPGGGNPIPFRGPAV